MPDFFCEVETSCSVKLVRTKGKVGGHSCVDVGLINLFHVGFESMEEGLLAYWKILKVFFYRVSTIDVQQKQYYC